MAFLPKWEALRGLSTADTKEAFTLLSRFTCGNGNIWKHMDVKKDLCKAFSLHWERYLLPFWHLRALSKCKTRSTLKKLLSNEQTPCFSEKQVPPTEQSNILHSDQGLRVWAGSIRHEAKGCTF